MGYGRAGWYSHDRLDHGGRPSAEDVRPDLPAIRRGDLLPSTADGRTAFEVLDLREGAHLVLGFHMDRPFRSVRWAEPSTRISQRATWAFALRRAGPGSTLLLVRARGRSRPAWFWAPWDAFFRLAHLPMHLRCRKGLGYLAQEPQLDPAKDVKGHVLDGVREVAGLIEQYNAVMAKWAAPDADYMRCASSS